MLLWQGRHFSQWNIKINQFPISILMIGLSPQHHLYNNIKQKYDSCLRKTLNIQWSQRVQKMKQIKEMTGLKKRIDEIRIRKWNWIGHKLRIE